MATLALAGLAACGGGSSHIAIKLDGSPHPGTDAGVITAADAHHVVVDGKRRYRVDRRLIVFSPGTLELAPLYGTVGRYSLLAAKGGLVSWIEPLSVVTAFRGLPRTVFLFGTVTRLAGGEATFSDGTVLPTEPGVGLPAGASLPLRVRADLDPDRHAVRALASS